MRSQHSQVYLFEPDEFSAYAKCTRVTPDEMFVYTEHMQFYIDTPHMFLLHHG